MTSTIKPSISQVILYQMFRCHAGSFISSLKYWKSNGTTGKSKAPANTLNKKPFLLCVYFAQLVLLVYLLRWHPILPTFQPLSTLQSTLSIIHHQHFPTIIQKPDSLLVQYLTVGYRPSPSWTLPPTSPWKLSTSLQWLAVLVASRWRGFQSIGDGRGRPPTTGNPLFLYYITCTKY